MRRLLTLLLLLAPPALLAAALVPAAGASTTQTAIFQDDQHLFTNPAGTLTALRTLGVSEVRVSLFWASVATGGNPGRQASNPAAYPAANWARYDNVVRAASARGIAVLFDIQSPVPIWASGGGYPRNGGSRFRLSWKPDPVAFGAFVKAVGTRYSGHYAGLPRVGNWSVWNEPNYGPSLAPQSRGSSVQLAAASYRGLVDHAFSALRSSGHGRDTLLFGEVAPHGRFVGGDFGGVAPLEFLRGLYCVDGRFHPLRGRLAGANGCPTTAAASRRFRSQHPALFSATGFADHPYAQGTPPNRSLRVSGYDSADFSDLAMVPRLESTLDRANRAYGSHKRFTIWNTEYGFQTNPPEHSGNGNFPVSPDTAAAYMNWAEYISYKSSRIHSYDQYLLVDPSTGQFASGLLFPNGSPKSGFGAYRIPLYLPRTSARKGAALEVWGAVRPAKATIYGPGQQARIEFQAGGRGAYATVRHLTVPRSGYFDLHLGFGQSGIVRIAWASPGGGTEYSRSVAVRIR